MKGADDKSARWKHLIVLGGLLTGFEAHERQCLPLKLRELLESAIVTAVNLSLEAEEEGSHQDRLTILIVLAHSFDLLSVHEKLKLNAFRLLPVLMSAVYFSKEGLHRGYFLGTMDSDIVQGKQNKFNWSERSASFYQVQHIATGPILSTLGSLSKLTAFCVESVLDTSLVFNVLDDLTAFSRSLSVQWRQNKLSELDASEEELFLAADALERTLPLLWQVLKSAMFSVVIVQSALISRSLRDPRMPRDKLLYVAVSSLRTLRNLYFISSRLGHNSFSQFNFVFNASIDMLTKYPAQLQDFMLEISPKNFGGIPDHPQERCHDLFFLNTAEHVALESSPEQCEQLYLGAAGPYLGMGGDLRLNEIFEAAHSVVLAVFSAPQNFEITTQRLPSYIDTLFQVSLGFYIMYSGNMLTWNRFFHLRFLRANFVWPSKHLLGPPLPRLVSQRRNHYLQQHCSKWCATERLPRPPPTLYHLFPPMKTKPSLYPSKPRSYLQLLTRYLVYLFRIWKSGYTWQQRA